MTRQVVALLLAGLLAASLGCSAVGLSGSSSPPAAERERAETLQGYLSRMAVPVREAVVKQSWYRGGKTSDDGMRLAKSLASDFLYTRREPLEALRLYPDGLDAAREAQLAKIKGAETVRQVMLSPWFVDGLTPQETRFLDAAIKVQSHSAAFFNALLGAMAAPWFADGIDEREEVLVQFVLRAALEYVNGFDVAMTLLKDGFSSPWFADGVDEYELTIIEAADSAIRPQLLSYLDRKPVSSRRLVLPESGEKLLLINTESPNLVGLAAPGLDMLERLAPRVEAFAGPYRPNFLAVTLVDVIAGSACGLATTAQRGDIPGAVTLEPGCVRDQALTHELAHVFIGSGPAWFSEGVAELTVLHVLNARGSYLSRRATGRIEVNTRPPLDSPEYANQGALGAQLLAEIYRVIGPERMSQAVRDIASRRLDRDGRRLLDTFLAYTPEQQKAEVRAIIDQRVAP